MTPKFKEALQAKKEIIDLRPIGCRFVITVVMGNIYWYDRKIKEFLIQP